MPQDQDRGQAPTTGVEGASLAISREVAALQKRYFGKGPESVRTVYKADMVVVLLSGGFTVIEKTLQDDNQAGAVDDNRMAFQRAMMVRFKEVVSRLTGREIVAFMSANHQEPDMSVEIFVLVSEKGAREDDDAAAAVTDENGKTTPAVEPTTSAVATDLGTP